MSSATWTPATNASSATWDKNKTRADLERAVRTYNEPGVTYNQIGLYYNGYNPSTTTPEGESGALWTEVSE